MSSVNIKKVTIRANFVQHTSIVKYINFNYKLLIYIVLFGSIFAWLSSRKSIEGASRFISCYPQNSPFNWLPIHTSLLGE